MKHFIKKLARRTVEKYLLALVKIKCARTKPTIMGITGSYGKTSTKEAIYWVLRGKLRARRSGKSLNTEIGLLLAVLEQNSGFSSPLKWLYVCVAALFNAFFSKKYDVMILEYGADKPGDISHLIACVKPDIAVITHIAHVHGDSGQFENAAQVFDEKKRLVTLLSEGGVAILNRADPFLQKLEGVVKSRIFWWNGTAHDPRAHISAHQLKEGRSGFSATISEKKAAHALSMPAHFGVLGAHHIDVMLPSLLCGSLYGIPVEDSLRALANFQLPPGRMSLIDGVNGSHIIDSSYNASPHTMREALRLLKAYPREKGGRKIAVLGSMNELGLHGAKAARDLAHEIGDWLDMLVTVGGGARGIAEEALKIGFSASKIKTLGNAYEAADFLLGGNLKCGDVILCKGSQNNVRLERTVKRLMARPEEAPTLLCRQEKEWKNIE